MARKPSTPKSVETLKHDEDKRKNIPTAEFQSVLQKEEQNPVRVAYKRAAAGDSEEKLNRNRDLDPQLVWRGKDEQDWSDLVVHAPPLYIQEKVHPKVLIRYAIPGESKDAFSRLSFEQNLSTQERSTLGAVIPQKWNV